MTVVGRGYWVSSLFCNDTMNETAINGLKGHKQAQMTVNVLDYMTVLFSAECAGLATVPPLHMCFFLHFHRKYRSGSPIVALALISLLQSRALTPWESCTVAVHVPSLRKVAGDMWHRKYLT